MADNPHKQTARIKVGKKEGGKEGNKNEGEDGNGREGGRGKNVRRRDKCKGEGDGGFRYVGSEKKA